MKTVGRGNCEVLVYILLVWECMAPNPWKPLWRGGRGEVLNVKILACCA